jgi:hypothetical protein
LLNYWQYLQYEHNATFADFDSVLPSEAPPVLPENLEVLNATYSIGDDLWYPEYRQVVAYNRNDDLHLTFG